MHPPRRAIFLCGFVMALAPAWAAPGILKVRIFDAGHKTFVPARVNVIGADNAFYEPDPSRNPLAEYSLKRKGNRSNVGPLRYCGSFFYTDGTFEVKPGSLFPALHRMEEFGWLKSNWGDSENNRRAKYYALSKAGRRQLDTETKDWQRISLGITSALRAT